MNLIINLLLVSLLSLPSINARELNIDNLLIDIEKKTDLSEKTKLENSGISLIFTRDDIQRMQARQLKDILKTIATFGYNENNFGVPDPMTQGTSIPYMSSFVRVFIDNEEFETGMYGSGLPNLGDIHIGFVDHIEIYTQTPTYEYSTEPTLMLIKIHSKSVKKDSGNQIELNTGSYGQTRLSGYSSSYINNDWSYFSYISAINEKRQKHDNKGTSLSRDKKVAHIFSTFKNEKNTFTFNALKINKDGFIGLSLDGTPTSETVVSNSFKLAYNGQHEKFFYLLSYSFVNTIHNFTDDIGPLAMLSLSSSSHTVTTDFKYKHNINNNMLVSGIKYRHKKFKYDYYKVNNSHIPTKSNDQQRITTLFLENQYNPIPNFILTSGVEYINVYNKGATHNVNNNLFLYRLGLTYLKDNWSFKTIAMHSESYLQPYLVDSNYIFKKEISPESTDSIHEEISYQYKQTNARLILGYLVVKNFLIPSYNPSIAPADKGKLDNHSKNIITKTAVLRIEQKYNKYDKLFFETSYLSLDNLMNSQAIKFAKVIVRNTNTYQRYDFYNELIYDRNNITSRNFYDFSSGVTYHYTDDLTISFKAENIFSKAKETSYTMVNPLTYQPEDPLNISPFDKKIMFNMEYLF